jgi:DNA-directed RNA polymerase subunit beta'
MEGNLKEFDAIKLSVASPDDILSWSHGEIQKPETINYRTQKPEKNGLFCERIFGPTRDWECYCGKYKKIRYKGIICEKCGVEVTRSAVRRERIGHINLAAPCSHIWFLRSTPSRIGLMLDISVKNLERVIYFDSYIVTKVNNDLKNKKIKSLDLVFKIKKQEVNKEFKKRIDGLKSKISQKKPTSEQEKQIRIDVKRISKEKKETLENLDEEKKLQQEALENLSTTNIISEEEYQELFRECPDVFEAKIGAEAIHQLLSEIDLGKLSNNLQRKFKVAFGQKRKRLIKRLRVVQNFIKTRCRPEWTILTVLPVIPPDLRPMVQLDGGRFATADLNDLYRRVINRNNRLRRLMEIDAPEIIKRNEKRMLQEAVDSLIDNSARGARAVVTGAAKRKLRSLSDILKGKQGRFRQNLLGKRVDYSGRSVIVIGPSLKLNQCGLPKKMALELFKPFVISKLIKEEYAHNVRSAIRLIEKSRPEIWDMLERVIHKYYVLLNRAPTLHRLGIQAFKPVLIEGDAIQIHPLVCAAFNADFDGDQMAVHIPLSQKAQKEAEEIMLSGANLLKPADGTPVTTPTQDIVLGCYYMTSFMEKAEGEGKVFKDREEALTAYQLSKIALVAKIKVMIGKKLIETSVGRIIFNETLPSEFEFINEAMTQKSLKRVISKCYFQCGAPETVRLLDKIKQIGFFYATKSGISIAIGDIEVPKEKRILVREAQNKIEEIRSQYKRGLLTDYEKYLRTLEVWMGVKDKIAKALKQSLDKYSSIFSIVSSGARGSIDQVIQLGGMKGLVVNPAGDIIQLPIISSFKEGFNVLEYFISTHGSRKGKSDTALRTSDSGYLTRRLVDVVQDIVVTEEDCGKSEGFVIFKKGIENTGMSFVDKLLGRFAAEDILDNKGKIICSKNEEITLTKAKEIEEKTDQAKIRSVLTCQSDYGVCAKCYGRNLARGTLIKQGEPVGIIAAQSIGEPGTQLTMQTFHRGGVAGEDITSGLPRVEELFEVRSPKGQAILAPKEGMVRIEKKAEKKTMRLVLEEETTKVYKSKKDYKLKIKNGQKIKEGNILLVSKKKEIKSSLAGKVKLEKNKIIILGKKISERKYIIPARTTILVNDKDRVSKGDQLTSGPLNLQELLKLKGTKAVQQYIISEVQKIYASQGPTIADKHLEVIIRKMFSRIRIKLPGDTEFLVGEITNVDKVEEENKKMRKKSGKKAVYEPLLLGITKAALLTDSFLSAASFQETTRSLVEAAISGAVDKLRGLKENVIIGRLIPTGTGFKK